MRLIEFSIKQRVLVNMLMMGLFIAGVICMLNLRREVFPSISTDVITVTTLDVTLDSPEDVERLITVPIEDKLRSIEDIKEINSISSPNLSAISLKLYDNVTDIQVVLNDVRQEVDSAKTDLPKTSESPITIEQKFPFPVMIVGMRYQPGMNLLKIKKLADKLQDQFESIQGVSEVVLRGLTDREIWVEVDPYRARALNISLEEINSAINLKNKNIPGGIIKGDSGETTIRVLEQINDNTWRDLENIVVKNSTDRIIRLRDIATIKNTFDPATRTITMSDDQQAIVSSIDLVQGDITHGIDPAFAPGKDDALREFHERQVKHGNDIIVRNITLLKDIVTEIIDIDKKEEDSKKPEQIEQTA